MAGRAWIPILVGGMLLTGVCNTLLTKYQDMQCVRNCDSPNRGERQNFEQPVWQTLQMFVGEMLCWLVVLGSELYQRFSGQRTADGYEPVGSQTRSIGGTGEGEVEQEEIEASIIKPLLPGHQHERHPLKGWRVVLLGLPACCDIAGTTLMNVGLLFVAASIYQMTRGALVLFVGLFSVIFLKTHLSISKWVSLLIVVAGVAVVGVAGALEQRVQHPRLPGDTDPPPPSHDDPLRKSHSLARALYATTANEHRSADVETLIGIVIIFCAQIFSASQFVIEEAIMHRYSQTPLIVTGYEGTFGFLTTLLLMLILHFSYGRTEAGRGGYFDATTGWSEMTQHPAIGWTSLLIMVSIGGFNFFGLSVTRSVSATSRSTIDTCRTLFIWVISLGLGWESFKWLQVLGFAALVYGTFLFNEIVRPPGLAWIRRRVERGGEDPPQAIEHS